MTTTLTQPEVHPLVSELTALAGKSIAAGPAHLRGVRQQALNEFTSLGFPNTRQEDWRFTNLAALTSNRFVAPGAPAPVQPDQVAAFAVPGLACHTLVFIDGHYAPQLSDIRKLPDGVVVTTLHEAFTKHRAIVDEHFTTIAPFESSTFAALNTAMLGDGVFIHVPRGVEVADPIHLINIATGRGEPAITCPRNLVIVGERARVDLIEHYVALEQGVYLSNAVTEIFIGDSAHAGHYFIEEESNAAFNISSLHAKLGRATTFDSHSILLGGAIVRNNVNPILDGDGGNCLINGLFVGGGSQHMDNLMRVEHLKPNCESHQYYNGILADQSHGVFSGRIYVDRVAQKTDAKQTSANLLLSDDAQIDTKPQLEIYADDVKCTHGATIGQLDEDALFYLRSRGIAPDAARAMLVFAFAAETFNRMKLEPIRQMLERKMLSRLPEGDFLATVL
ncbi:MAG: Fe-S cluster assembly protein SufD [Phycisphaeraceae bacterium]